MSEPTNAEMAEQEDMRLDAQIAEHEQEKYEQRMRDEAAMREPPDNTEPQREPPTEPYWFDDREELVTFARWYFDGHSSVRIKLQIFALFETPWKWTPEYEEFLAQKVKII